jgi:preprotein translocase subunit YajC
MPLLSLPLSAAPASAPQQPSFFLNLIPILLIFVVFYFLLIAPARRKQKKHAEMLEKLRAGDKVVTTGGIRGTVVGVANDIVQLRIADQVKIEVEKSAIAGLLEPSR